MEESLAQTGADRDKEEVEDLAGKSIVQPVPARSIGAVSFGKSLADGKWVSLQLDLAQVELGFNEPMMIPLPGLVKELERGKYEREILNLDPEAAGNEPLKGALRWASTLKEQPERKRVEMIFAAVDSLLGLAAPELTQTFFAPGNRLALAEAVTEPIYPAGHELNEREVGRWLHKFIGSPSDPRDIVRRVQALTDQHRGKEVPIGLFMQEGCGVCRHRTLLFRELGRAAGLNAVARRGNVPGGRHAWNEVILSGGQVVLVDVFFEPRIAWEPGQAHRYLYGETVPVIRAAEGDLEIALGPLPEQEGLGLIIRPRKNRAAYAASVVGLRVQVDASHLDPAQLNEVLGKGFRIEGEQLIEIRPEALRRAAPAAIPPRAEVVEPRKPSRTRWAWTVAGILLLGAAATWFAAVRFTPERKPKEEVPIPKKEVGVLKPGAGFERYQAVVTPELLRVQFPKALSGKWVRAFLRTDLYYPQEGMGRIPEDGLMDFRVPIFPPARPGWVDARGRAVAVFDSEEAAWRVRSVERLAQLEEALVVLGIEQDGKTAVIRGSLAGQPGQRAGLEEKSLEASVEKELWNTRPDLAMWLGAPEFKALGDIRLSAAQVRRWLKPSVSRNRLQDAVEAVLAAVQSAREKRREVLLPVKKGEAPFAQEPVSDPQAQWVKESLVPALIRWQEGGFSPDRLPLLEEAGQTLPDSAQRQPWRDLVRELGVWMAGLRGGEAKLSGGELTLRLVTELNARWFLQPQRRLFLYHTNATEETEAGFLSSLGVARVDAERVFQLAGRPVRVLMLSRLYTPAPIRITAAWMPSGMVILFRDRVTLEAESPWDTEGLTGIPDDILLRTGRSPPLYKGAMKLFEALSRSYSGPGQFTEVVLESVLSEELWHALTHILTEEAAGRRLELMNGSFIEHFVSAILPEGRVLREIWDRPIGSLREEDPRVERARDRLGTALVELAGQLGKMTTTSSPRDVLSHWLWDLASLDRRSDPNPLAELWAARLLAVELQIPGAVPLSPANWARYDDAQIAAVLLKMAQRPPDELRAAARRVLRREFSPRLLQEGERGLFPGLGGVGEIWTSGLEEDPEVRAEALALLRSNRVRSGKWARDLLPGLSQETLDALIDNPRETVERNQAQWKTNKRLKGGGAANLLVGDVNNAVQRARDIVAGRRKPAGVPASASKDPSARMREILRIGFGDRVEKLDVADLKAIRDAGETELVHVFLNALAAALSVPLGDALRTTLVQRMAAEGVFEGVLPRAPMGVDFAGLFEMFVSSMPLPVAGSLRALVQARDPAELETGLQQAYQQIQSYLDQATEWDPRAPWLRPLVEPGLEADPEAVSLVRMAGERLLRAMGPQASPQEISTRVEGWIKRAMSPNLRQAVRLMEQVEGRPLSLQSAGSFQLSMKRSIVGRLVGGAFVYRAVDSQGRPIARIAIPWEGPGSELKLIGRAAHELTHQALDEADLPNRFPKGVGTGQADWITGAAQEIIQRWRAEEMAVTTLPATGSFGVTLSDWLYRTGRQIARTAPEQWTSQVRGVMSYFPPNWVHYAVGIMVSGIAEELGEEAARKDLGWNRHELALHFVLGRFVFQGKGPISLDELAQAALEFRRDPRPMPDRRGTQAGLEEVQAEFPSTWTPVEINRQLLETLARVEGISEVERKRIERVLRKIIQNANHHGYLDKEGKPYQPGYKTFLALTRNAEPLQIVATLQDEIALSQAAHSLPIKPFLLTDLIPPPTEDVTVVQAEAEKRVHERAGGALQIGGMGSWIIQGSVTDGYLLPIRWEDITWDPKLGNRYVLRFPIAPAAGPSTPLGIGLEEEGETTITVPVADHPALRQLFHHPEIRVRAGLQDTGRVIRELPDPERSRRILQAEAGPNDVVVLVPEAEPGEWLAAGLESAVLVMPAHVAAGLEEREWAALLAAARVSGGSLRIREITRTGLEERQVLVLHMA